MIFGPDEIRGVLPHRYPILLLDGVLEFTPGVRGIGVKNVTWNEPYFASQAKHQARMPPVLIMEAMAQTAAFLCLKSTPGESKSIIYLVGVDDFEWHQPVVPGDTLHIHINFLKQRGVLWVVDAKALVGTELAARGKLSAAKVSAKLST